MCGCVCQNEGPVKAAKEQKGKKQDIQRQQQSLKQVNTQTSELTQRGVSTSSLKKKINWTIKKIKLEVSQVP